MQVDEIPLSRPKRNIARDFSDAGVLDARKLHSEFCCDRNEDQTTSVLMQFSWLRLFIIFSPGMSSCITTGENQ